MLNTIRTTAALLASMVMTVPSAVIAQEKQDVTLEEAKDCYILYSVVSVLMEEMGEKKQAFVAFDTSLTWSRAVLGRVKGTTHAIDAEIKQESDELKAMLKQAMASDPETFSATQQRLTSLKGGCDDLEKRFLS